MTRVPLDAGEGPQWNPHTPTLAELADVFAEERTAPTYTGWHVPGWPKTGPRSDLHIESAQLTDPVSPDAPTGHVAPLLWDGDDA